MDYKGMAKVLSEFISDEFENEDFDEFFSYNDLGIPLSVCVNQDICTLNDEGQKILEETYNYLCDLLAVERKIYDSYSDLRDSKE